MILKPSAMDMIFSIVLILDPMIMTQPVQFAEIAEFSLKTTGFRECIKRQLDTIAMRRDCWLVLV